MPNPPGELDEYDKLKTKLNNYFTTKKNKHHARYLFHKLRPNIGETVAVYATRLREKANECEFEENSDQRILEHLIHTTHKRTLIQKAINKKWDLSQFLTEAGQMEDTSLQIPDMNVPEFGSVKYVNKDDQYRKRRILNAGKSAGRQLLSCNYYGQTGTHVNSKNYSAYGKMCKKCRKYNHFAVVCRSSKLDT